MRPSAGVEVKDIFHNKIEIFYALRLSSYFDLYQPPLEHIEDDDDDDEKYGDATEEKFEKDLTIPIPRYKNLIFFGIFLFFILEF